MFSPGIVGLFLCFYTIGQPKGVKEGKLTLGMALQYDTVIQTLWES